MSQKEYRRKRNFQKTPEPPPQQRKAKKQPRRKFVIQEHHASHLHWDFRLEAFGTLKSWAVPKGISKVVGERRLAVQVEDHPLDYASFEGEIPEGQYGAGKVKIWDQGTWTPLKPLRKAFETGHLEIQLEGKKLQGRWHLVRTQGKGTKSQWLLMKGKEATESKKIAKAQGRKQSFPTKIKPQLATLVADLPSGDAWLYEIKLDGYRTLAFVKNRKVKLRTRNSLDWTPVYSSVAESLKRMKIQSAVFDGEMIVRDSEGRSSFALLKKTLSLKQQKNLEYCVFDILYLNGKSLEHLPLLQRKNILKKLLKSNSQKNISYSDHQEGQGAQLWQQSCALGLEGLIAKNSQQSYSQTRSRDWLKLKCHRRQEFVILGFTEPQRSREGFGALLLGYYQNHKLQYAGRVGTGFSQQSLHNLFRKLKNLRTAHSSLENPPAGKGVTWVKPFLVCEVQYAEWPQGGVLRHPVFLGLREDKSSEQVRREEMSLVKLTHPERVLYEYPEVNKGQVFHYYEQVADLFLKYSASTPLALLRCPQTAQAHCFFQKHIDSLEGKPIYEGQVRDQEYLYIDSPEGLLSLVQYGCVEFHAWPSRLPADLRPRQMVFDLDPGEGVTWRQLVGAALEVKEILADLKLESFVKVTGGKGLHIHVPIASKYSYEMVKEFTRSVCMLLAKEKPRVYTINMSRKVRHGRIFLDYLRNGFGATAVAPYSLRAGPAPLVAVPISWEELQKARRHLRFDIKATLKRISENRKDPWENFEQRQRIRLLESQDFEIFQQNIRSMDL